MAIFGFLVKIPQIRNAGDGVDPERRKEEKEEVG